MGMRLYQALGISVCLLFATQLACSSSNNGRKADGAPDGAPADGSPSYKDMSGPDSPDSNDGSTDTGRDASIESAPAGFEVGPETALDLSPAPDSESHNDTAMPDLPLDVPTDGDLPALSIDTGRDIGIDGQAVDQMPGSSIDGRDGTSASDESRSNPCASCAANQVCVQLNDGTCSATTGVRTACRAVSDGCRTKLANSGSKSCSSLSECESELCPLPSYECVYASPCGNEIPEAAVYCYGI
jgi:hypothetical protein